MIGELLLGVILGLVLAWAFLVVLLYVARPRDVGLAEVLAVVPDVLRLARDLLADPAVPVSVRLALVLLAAWLLSPIDLVPEFIPVLGPLDDVVVAVLVLRWVRRRLGGSELQRRWPGTPEGYRVLERVIGSDG